MQLIIERHNLAVHLGDGEMIADIRVDRVGKINRCRSSRQRHDISLWSKKKYLILKNIDLHVAHELDSFLVFVDNFFDGFDPITILGGFGFTGFRIGKVCRHSDLCLSVHLECANLDLSRLRPQFRKKSYDRRVQ